MEIINLVIAFVAGVVTSVGVYIAFKQLRQSEPSIVLLYATGSNRLPPEWEENDCSLSFHFTLQNRKGIEYAVANIHWRAVSVKIRKSIPHYDKDYWQRLQFDNDILEQASVNSRKPVIFKPYEHRELRGYWWNSWVGNPHSDVAKEYWRENKDNEENYHKLLEAIYNNKIEYRLTFADGRTTIYKNFMPAS